LFELCRLTDFDMGALSDGTQAPFSQVFRYTIDVHSGDVVETCLAHNLTADFPTMPPQLIGRRAKYTYASCASDEHGILHFSTCAPSEFVCLRGKCVVMAPWHPRGGAHADCQMVFF
jgi:carotenoid cleavage dioxygenase-like enzyme